jgi:hypothetical protein
VLQSTQPRLDDRRLERAQLPLPELLDGVEAKPVLRHLSRGLGEGLRLEPSLGEVAEGDFAGVGADEGAAQDVGGDGREEPLGVGLASEVPGSLVPVRISVAGLPSLAVAVAGGPHSLAVDRSFPSVLDVRHGLHLVVAEWAPRGASHSFERLLRVVFRRRVGRSYRRSQEFLLGVR